MNWLRDLSRVEYTFMALFGLLYLIYAIKMYTLSRKLQVRIYRVLLKFFLRTAYVALFIISLLGPSFGDIKKEIKAIAREIYVVVDLSSSMNARDIAPSRLEKVKKEIGNVVASLSSDKLGLVVFARDCQWICPPTYDKDAFVVFLNSLSTNMVAHQGSNFSSLSACLFKEVENKEQSRIVLLVSDGENFGADATTLFSKLREKNIYTFVLGVGSESEVRIPEGERGWMRDANGKEITTLFNRQYLKDMADIANGRYYEINESSADVKAMISRINKIDGQLQGSRKIDSVANKYYYFLFVGIGLLVADILITVTAVKF